MLFTQITLFVNLSPVEHVIVSFSIYLAYFFILNYLIKNCTLLKISIHVHSPLITSQKEYCI